MSEKVRQLMGISVDFIFSYAWDAKEIVKYTDTETYYYTTRSLHARVVVRF